MCVCVYIYITMETKIIFQKHNEKNEYLEKIHSIKEQNREYFLLLQQNRYM